jgi:hypothetical protein
LSGGASKYATGPGASQPRAAVGHRNVTGLPPL